MLRSILVAVGFVTLSLSQVVLPAQAGPAESAFLQKLASTWSGRGNMTGAQTGPIACKMVVRAASQKATYQGRCNIPDVAARTFTGSITYNDARQRYEARSMGGTVIGVKQGSSLVFNSKNSSIAGTAYSKMTLSPTRLVMDFTLVDRKTGEKTNTEVVFSK